MPTKYIQAREKVGPEIGQFIKAKLEKLVLQTNTMNDVAAKIRKIEVVKCAIVERIAGNIEDGQYIKI